MQVPSLSQALAPGSLQGSPASVPPPQLPPLAGVAPAGGPVQATPGAYRPSSQPVKAYIYNSRAYQLSTQGVPNSPGVASPAAAESPSLDTSIQL